MDITVEKLSKNYGNKRIFEDFSIFFKGGETTVLMGRSGTGKTTLLNCIAKLTSFSGKIYGAEKVSYVFQEDRLIPHKTVYGNLDFIMDRKLSGNERAKLIGEMLELLEIKDKATHFSSELSGGEKKRVALARAFLCQSDVLIMDEPLNSLDIGLKMRLYEVFNKLVLKFNKTVIYVTHDIDEALSVGNCIKVLGDNKIIYESVIEEQVLEREITSEKYVDIRKNLIEKLIAE